MENINCSIPGFEESNESFKKLFEEYEKLKLKLLHEEYEKLKLSNLAKS